MVRGLWRGFGCALCLRLYRVLVAVFNAILIDLHDILHWLEMTYFLSWI